MYYKCHKKNLKPGRSHINSPDWIKTKKATISSTNEDDKYFQYAAAVALNHEETKRDPQRISKTKSFINKYHWNGTKYPSKIDDWKTFHKKLQQLLLIFIY